MRRSRVAGLVSSGTLLAAAMVFDGLLWGNPDNLVYGPEILIASIGVTIALIGITAGLACTRRAFRVVFTAAGCALGPVAAGALLLLGSAFDTDGTVESRVSSADGRYELAVVEGASFVAIDPIRDVRIRAGRGLTAQEAAVWQGVEEGPSPRRVRFSGPRQIEVTTDDGCVYRSTFNGQTLEVDPLHVMVHGRSGC